MKSSENEFVCLYGDENSYLFSSLKQAYMEFNISVIPDDERDDISLLDARRKTARKLAASFKYADASSCLLANDRHFLRGHICSL